MNDDRFTHEPDEANGNDPERPYLDRTPPPGVRPASMQPDHRGPPTPDEIAEFIRKEFGVSESKKKKLIRPADWDGAVDPAEDFPR